MKLLEAVRSQALRAWLSPAARRVSRRAREGWRRLRGRPHVVTAFLGLDDPYSWLLCHYLPELERHYDIELHVCLAEALGGGYRPAPDMHAEYALIDCRRLAAELGIPFLDRGRTPPVEHRRALLDALAARAHEPDFSEQLIDALEAYWRGDADGVARRAEGVGNAVATAQLLDRNRQLLERLGHYATGTLHYAGEWYAGVERMGYLTERLNGLAVAREPGLPPRITSIQHVMQPDLPVTPPSAADKLPPIELFCSFRSPYSYIGLDRFFRIADAFGVAVVVRPVLPMVTRGLALPKRKLRYILSDANREARRHGVAFGHVADPLGAGIERLMATFVYAREQRREREFMLAAGRAVWSRGVDVATDAGLRKVTARAGLFWPDVLASLDDETWRDEAGENREALSESGLWGVPSVRVGDWATWGQDRDWLLALRLEELCDSGDGILV